MAATVATVQADILSGGILGAGAEKKVSDVPSSATFIPPML